MKKYSDLEIKEIYDRNVNRLYKIAYNYFNGNKANIDDAIQDVFLKFIEKNIIFNDLEHEKAWFIVALQNKCKNMLKAKWNQEEELIIDVANKEDIEDNTIDLIKNLPKKYMLPIYLFYYENYSCLEIAKMLNTNENTIYTNLSRARKMLKMELEELK